MADRPDGTARKKKGNKSAGYSLLRFTLITCTLTNRLLLEIALSTLDLVTSAQSVSQTIESAYLPVE